MLSTEVGFESGRNQQNLFLSAIEGGVDKALDHHYNCCFLDHDVCSCNINHYLAPPLNLICTEPIFMVQSFALTFPFFSPKLPSMPDIIKYLEYKVSHWLL